MLGEEIATGRVASTSPFLPHTPLRAPSPNEDWQRPTGIDRPIADPLELDTDAEAYNQSYSGGTFASLSASVPADGDGADLDYALGGLDCGDELSMWSFEVDERSMPQHRAGGTTSSFRMQQSPDAPVAPPQLARDGAATTAREPAGVIGSALAVGAWNSPLDAGSCDVQRHDHTWWEVGGRTGYARPPLPRQASRGVVPDAKIASNVGRAPPSGDDHEYDWPRARSGQTIDWADGAVPGDRGAIASSSSAIGAASASTAMAPTVGMGHCGLQCNHDDSRFLDRGRPKESQAAVGSFPMASSRRAPEPFAPEWWEVPPEGVIPPERMAAPLPAHSFRPRARSSSSGFIQAAAAPPNSYTGEVVRTKERRRPHDAGPSLALPTLGPPAHETAMHAPPAPASLPDATHREQGFPGAIYTSESHEYSAAASRFAAGRAWEQASALEVEAAHNAPVDVEVLERHGARSLSRDTGRDDAAAALAVEAAALRQENAALRRQIAEFRRPSQVLPRPQRVPSAGQESVVSAPPHPAAPVGASVAVHGGASVADAPGGLGVARQALSPELGELRIGGLEAAALGGAGGAAAVGASAAVHGGAPVANTPGGPGVARQALSPELGELRIGGLEAAALGGVGGAAAMGAMGAVGEAWQAATQQLSSGRAPSCASSRPAAERCGSGRPRSASPKNRYGAMTSTTCNCGGACCGGSAIRQEESEVVPSPHLARCGKPNGTRRISSRGPPRAPWPRDAAGAWVRAPAQQSPPLGPGVGRRGGCTGSRIGYGQRVRTRGSSRG